MQCLTGVIGLSASCSDAVYSMGYAEDLEGVSLKSLSAVEGGKYLTAQRMIDEKMRIVGSKMLEKLGNMLGEVVIEQSVQTIIPLQFSEDYLTGASGNPGLRIEKKRTRLTKLFIPTFYFKSHTEVNDLTVTITDGQQSVDFSVSAEADEEVAIECNFSTNNLWVEITYSGSDPSSTVEPYTGSISPYHHYASHGCDSCDSCGNHYLKMVGLNFTGDEVSNYYGIRAQAMLMCDVEKMICLIASKNPWIFKYGLGVEIANEAITTERMNFFATNSKEMWRELAAKWQFQQDELWASNGVSIKKILENAEPDCFICQGAHIAYSIG